MVIRTVRRNDLHAIRHVPHTKGRTMDGCQVTWDDAGGVSTCSRSGILAYPVTGGAMAPDGSYDETEIHRCRCGISVQCTVSGKFLLVEIPDERDRDRGHGETDSQSEDVSGVQPRLFARRDSAPLDGAQQVERGNPVVPASSAVGTGSDGRSDSTPRPAQAGERIDRNTVAVGQFICGPCQTAIINGQHASEHMCLWYTMRVQCNCVCGEAG